MSAVTPPMRAGRLYETEVQFDGNHPGSNESVRRYYE